MEQLRLDLFPRPERDHVAEWREWLQEPFNDVNDEGLEVFDRLLEKYPMGEAFERSKCLKVTHGKIKVDGLTVDDLGLFTAEDYHTCWDRAWAAQNGYTPEQVRNIAEWDYRKKEPIYELPNGHQVL